VSDENLQLRRHIDETHLRRPFYGARRIHDWLQDEGFPVNRKRVRRLIREMDVTAPYRKTNRGQSGKGHKTSTYLLRSQDIDRSSHVWAEYT
jgi:putative transposase